MSDNDLNHSKSDEHLASNNNNCSLAPKVRIEKAVDCDLSAMSGMSGDSGQTASNSNNSGNSVKRKFRSLTFGRRKKSLSTVTNKANTNNSSKDNKDNGNNQQTSGKKKNRSSVWAFKLCTRTDSCCDVANADSVSNTATNCDTTATTCTSCICTGYKSNNDDHHHNSSVNTNNNNSIGNNIYNESNSGLCALFNASVSESPELMTASEALSYPNVESGIVSAVNNYHNATLPTGMMSEVRSVQVRVSELALALRSQLALTVSPYPYLARWGEVTELTPGFLNRFCIRDSSTLNQTDGQSQQIHTQIDYIHCLVPDLLDITNCSFYWGKMDRYEAERLLENKAEGTFLLRDSAQEEHLFSVSFRRFDRSLHARIEQWNHRFSFDSHDPGVYSSPTVCGLIEHYKDPSHCMFFEPMLTIPLHRNFPFSLQHMCRTTICSRVSYDSIQYLQLPKRLKNYLKEYHYKQQVRVRRLDGDH